MGILELLQYSREAFKYSPSQTDLFKKYTNLIFVLLPYPHADTVLLPQIFF